MYKFNYQWPLPEQKPYFVCVVPADWFSKKLPTMGGGVNYKNKREQLTSCGSIVYEFSDVPVTCDSSRTIFLDIVVGDKKLFGKPATIHCRNIEEQNLDGKWCIEDVLLNHLFGFIAPSASLGNNYLDYLDIEALLQVSSDFDFKFCIGETPSDILPYILDHESCRDVKCVFAMIFCSNQKMRMKYLDETVNALSAIYSENENAMILIADAGVEQEEMLISILVGR